MYEVWKPDLATQFSLLYDQHTQELSVAIFADQPDQQTILLIEQKMKVLLQEAVTRAVWIGKQMRELSYGEDTGDEYKLDQLIADLNELSDELISLRADLADCPLYELRCDFNQMIKVHSLYR